MSNIQCAVVEFHTQKLTVITDQKGERLVAMKPICENIGLTWSGQFERIKRNEVLNEAIRVIRTVAEDGKNRELVCLPLKLLNGWLFGVEASRVKPEIRDKLLSYQRECFDVLAAYWQQGEAINPRLETITPSEQRTLSEIVHRKAAPYGELQGKALAEIWSRLHHKFRIAKYSQLPRTQLTEAIVYVGQMELRLPLPVQDESTPEQRKQMHRAIQDVTSNWLLNTDSCRSWIHNRLRTEFNVRRLEDIPGRRVDEALALIAAIKTDGKNFLTLVCGMRESFCHEVIGAGHPWTPWITRHLGGAQALPPNPDWQALGKVLASKLSV